MGLDTRTKLMNEAGFLLRTRGYAAFSYADLAESVGVRKASIHHHFATKEDLGLALVVEYQNRFLGDVEKIEKEHQAATARLRAYAALFLASMENNQLPFCCAMAAERAALPEAMRIKVLAFFESQIQWLASVASQGLSSKEFRGGKPARDIALTLMGTLEGGCIMGWALQDKSSVLLAFNCLLDSMVQN